MILKSLASLVTLGGFSNILDALVPPWFFLRVLRVLLPFPLFILSSLILPIFQPGFFASRNFLDGTLLGEIAALSAAAPSPLSSSPKSITGCSEVAPVSSTAVHLYRNRGSWLGSHGGSERTHRFATPQVADQSVKRGFQRGLRVCGFQRGLDRD